MSLFEETFNTPVADLIPDDVFPLTWLETTGLDQIVVSGYNTSASADGMSFSGRVSTGSAAEILLQLPGLDDFGVLINDVSEFGVSLFEGGGSLLLRTERVRVRSPQVIFNPNQGGTTVASAGEPAGFKLLQLGDVAVEIARTDGTNRPTSVRVTLGTSPSLALNDLHIAIEIAQPWLHQVDPLTGRPVEGAFRFLVDASLTIALDGSSDFQILGLSIPPVEIGPTGIIIALDNCQLAFNGGGVPLSLRDLVRSSGQFSGLYARQARLSWLPQFRFPSLGLPGFLIDFRDVLIDDSGISFTLDQAWNVEREPGSPHQLSSRCAMIGGLFGDRIRVAFERATGSMVRNVPVGFGLDAWLEIKALQALLKARFEVNSDPQAEAGTIAISLAQDAGTIVVPLGVGTLSIENFTAAGVMAGDSVQVNGSTRLAFDLPGWHTGPIDVAASFSTDGLATSLSVALPALSLGPFGQISNARFEVAFAPDDDGNPRLSSFGVQVTLAWRDLAARLGLTTLPPNLPLPPDNATVLALIEWKDDGRLEISLEAASGDPSRIFAFLPAAFRPELRSVAFGFRATFPDAASFFGAGSADPISGEAFAKIRFRPNLPQGLADNDIINLQVGDDDGFIDAEMRASVGNAGSSSVSLHVGSPASLEIGIPNITDGPFLSVKLTDATVTLSNGAMDPASASIEVTGEFDLLPATIASSSLVGPHAARLLDPLIYRALHGSVTGALQFRGDQAALSLDCQFENAEIEIDLFDVIGNLARGMTLSPDVEQPSQSIDLDLEVAFGLRGIKLQIGSLDQAASTPATASLEVILGVRFGAIQVEGFLRFSDRELSIGVLEMIVPLTLPVFPLSQADLDLLRPNPADVNSVWTEARFQSRLAELQTRIDQLGAAPSRDEREELGLLLGQQFLLNAVFEVFTKVASSNRATYQHGVEFVTGLLHTATTALHVDSRVSLKLSNVRFLIPFADPRNIALEGSASLVGFSDDDPFKGLEEMPMTLGLSADQIYFAINSTGEPIPLPDFGRYPDGSVSLTKLTIGYGYTRNSLAIAFAGELALPPQLVADADTSRALPAGIRLPLFTKLAFRLDIIPIPGPIPVPAFDFNLDMRQPNSPALLDSQTCAPFWDGLQLIAPGIVRMGLKHLAFSPLFGLLPCPNLSFDGDLMLGDENNGATLIADNMLFLAGVGGSPPMPVPFVAAPNEPFFDNLCVNIRLAGFQLNFDLQRPFPSFNPIAIFEVMGLLADPLMEIDPEGALANSIRVSLKDAYIVIPAFVRRLFPQADSLNRKEVNITINLGTIISITQGGVEVVKAIWEGLNESGQNINRLLDHIRNNPPEITPASLISALPPELRKLRMGGSFAGFEASAILLLISPDDAARELQTRDHDAPPASQYQPRLGQVQAPGDLARFRPSLRSGPDGGRAFYPDDPANNLFRGIEFRDFIALDLTDIPQTGAQNGAAGIVVGAYVKVFGAQRYRFLGYLFDNGSFGLISSVDIQPLNLRVAGITFRLPLEVEGRLILEGRANRDGFSGSIRASVFCDWTIIPGIAVLQVGSSKRSARLRLHSDGHFAIAGDASLDLFNGGATVEGSVDISHTHCFVNGRLRFRAGIAALVLECYGRLGPGLHFELGGSGSLTLLGQDVIDVKGVVSEKGCELEARLSTKYWTIAGQHVPCELDLDLRGRINLAAGSNPEMALQGRGSLYIPSLGAGIDGQGGIKGGTDSLNTFLEGSLFWQGREWLAGRVELGTDGVRLAGRTSFALDLSPNNLLGIDLAKLFFKVDLEAKVSFDTIDGSASFLLKGDWSLAAKLPDGDREELTGQVFPLAAQHFNIDQSGSLEFELINVNKFVLVPFNGVRIPIPVITGIEPPAARFGVLNANWAMSWSGKTLEFKFDKFPVLHDFPLGEGSTLNKVFWNYKADLVYQDADDLIPIRSPQLDDNFVIALVWHERQLAIKVTRDNDESFFSLANAFS